MLLILRLAVDCYNLKEKIIHTLSPRCWTSSLSSFSLPSSLIFSILFSSYSYPLLFFSSATPPSSSVPPPSFIFLFFFSPLLYLFSFSPIFSLLFILPQFFFPSSAPLLASTSFSLLLLLFNPTSKFHPLLFSFCRALFLVIYSSYSSPSLSFVFLLQLPPLFSQYYFSSSPSSSDCYEYKFP